LLVYKSLCDVGVGVDAAVAEERPPAAHLLGVVDVDMQRSEQVRRWWPFLRDRRIENYNDILKRYID
jgi:N-carbamoylputrescine amidase